MQKKKILFILGAGASVDIGLPSGADLVREICKDVNIQYEYGRKQTNGNENLAAALRRAVTGEDGSVQNYNEHLSACWRLEAGLAQSPASIDSYLDSHSTDTKMIRVGKLAIALKILEAESRSAILVDRSNRIPRLNFSNRQNSWYPLLQNLIFTGVKKEELTSIFDDFSFISFNYDRCLEHFIFWALKGYFHLSDEDAARYASGLKIIHPYGKVAPLDWEIKTEGIQFGTEATSSDLDRASQRISLFTEGQNDSNLRNEITESISEATIMVFLGFAFHKQNVQLISMRNVKQNLQIFGTAFGISEFDKEAIRNSLFSAFPGVSSQNVLIVRGMRCRELFEQLNHTLRT